MATKTASTDTSAPRFTIEELEALWADAKARRSFRDMAWAREEMERLEESDDPC